MSGQSDERLPAFLTPPFLRTIGLVALVALGCELLVMPRLVGLDDAVWRTVLWLRGCATDRVVDRVVVATTRATIVILLVAAALRVRLDGVRAAWPSLAICLVGLQVGKLLKNVFARERPSMLSGHFIGHSFPSGHVMNTALAAIAIVVLAAAFRHRRRWWAVAVAIVAIIVFGRLLLAHHWFLDAFGGLLAAVALNGLMLPAVRRRPLLVPAGVALASTAALAVVLHAHHVRVRLPSPLSASHATAVELRIADALGTAALTGEWAPSAEPFRRGRYVWMNGHAAVVLTVPSTTPAVRDPWRVPAGSEASLAIAGLPDMHERRCLWMRIGVNGRTLRPFVPFFGWREYRLLLPPGTLRSGPNDVTIEVADAAGAPWRFAVVYVRLDLDR